MKFGVRVHEADILLLRGWLHLFATDTGIEGGNEVGRGVSFESSHVLFPEKLFFTTVKRFQCGNSTLDLQNRWNVADNNRLLLPLSSPAVLWSDSNFHFFCSYTSGKHQFKKVCSLCRKLTNHLKIHHQILRKQVKFFWNLEKIEIEAKLFSLRMIIQNLGGFFQ